MFDNPSPNYFAYLVRLWRSSETGIWRGMLQDPHSDQQLIFDSAEGLFVFLQSRLGEPPRVLTPLPSIVPQETIDPTS